VQLFAEGILDSFGTVSVLVEFQERLNIEVSISGSVAKFKKN